MSKQPDLPRMLLPRGWPQRVRSAVLHVIALAQYVMIYTRGWAADSPIARLRLKAETHLCLRFISSSLRAKDLRVSPFRRWPGTIPPHITRTERPR